MRKTTRLGLTTILAGSLLSATLAFAATDYSAMTTEELAAQRGTLHQATVEERNAFHNEWQKRVQQMSPEERRKALRPPPNAPRDGSGPRFGPGVGNSPTPGSGMGSGMGGGRR